MTNQIITRNSDNGPNGLNMNVTTDERNAILALDEMVACWAANLEHAADDVTGRVAKRRDLSRQTVDRYQAAIQATRTLESLNWALAPDGVVQNPTWGEVDLIRAEVDRKIDLLTTHLIKGATRTVGSTLATVNEAYDQIREGLLEIRGMLRL